MLAAAERAAQILTVVVARMREEPNPAVFAVHRATGQLGTSLQNGVERDLILTNKRTSTFLLVPILGKRENLLDAYDEKARLSAMLRIHFFMPSSYLLDAKAPRGGRGFSSLFHLKADQSRRPNTPRPKGHPAALPCPARKSSLRAPVRKDYLERKKDRRRTSNLTDGSRPTISYFQVVGEVAQQNMGESSRAASSILPVAESVRFRS